MYLFSNTCVSIASKFDVIKPPLKIRNSSQHWAFWSHQSSFSVYHTPKKNLPTATFKRRGTDTGHWGVKVCEATRCDGPLSVETAAGFTQEIASTSARQTKTIEVILQQVILPSPQNIFSII